MKNLAWSAVSLGVLMVGACNSKGAPSAAPSAAPVAVTTTVAAAAATATVQASTSAQPSAAAPSAATPDSAQPLYAVVGVASNDVLNVREKPEVSSKKVYSYSPAVKSIHATGQHVDKGGTPWVEVIFDGGTGWVNRLFLTEVRPGGGCNDPQVPALIRAFEKAVTDSDGAALKALVSPLRGLTVTPESKPLKFPYTAIDTLFSSPTVLNLGPGDGGGPDITGTFKTTIDVTLRKAILTKGAQEVCGKLLTGGSAATPPTQDEFPNVTPVSFHFPGVDGGGWVTWVASIEYVDGKPYVASLKQFHWEI